MECAPIITVIVVAICNSLELGEVMSVCIACYTINQLETGCTVNLYKWYSYSHIEEEVVGGKLPNSIDLHPCSRFSVSLLNYSHAH